jgi:hypothetical protein
MPARHQEHVDEWPEKVANVGGEEIDCVKRIGNREHRLSPKRIPAPGRVRERRLTEFVPCADSRPFDGGLAWASIFCIF